MTRDNAGGTLGSRCMNEEAYELFKAYWLREHISTERLLKNMREYISYTNDCVSNGEEFDSYDDWLFEYGFDGEIYPCFDEFDSCEYEDEELMKLLLPEEDYNFWLSEREK